MDKVIIDIDPDAIFDAIEERELLIGRPLSEEESKALIHQLLEAQIGSQIRKPKQRPHRPKR